MIKTLHSTLRAFFSMLLLGVLIGLLHDRDTMVALLLLALVPFVAWRTYKRDPHPTKLTILIAGALTTSLLGCMGEAWGISHGYWVYHDLPGDRLFPLWLPLAWGGAFIALYRFEYACIQSLNINTLPKKLLLAGIISATLPTWGEIVAIHLDVWHYTWSYQFFGVPLLAIMLLMLCHLGIYALFFLVCSRFDVRDRVFSMEPVVVTRK